MRRRFLRYSLVFASILPLMIGLAACDQAPVSEAPAPLPEEPEAEAAPEASTQMDLVDNAAVEEEALPEVAPPADLEALVVFIMGEALVQSDSGWEPLDVGSSLSVDDVIQVAADSYCEIELGRVATIRLDGDSEIALRDLVLTEDRSQVRVALNRGAILSRVEQLARGSKYSIQTDTAVAGVRGTEFRTAVEDDGAARVSVREGRVAVRPKLPAVDDFVAGNAAQEEAAERVRESLDDAAVPVEAGQELALAQAEQGRALERLAGQTERMQEAIEGADDAALEDVNREVQNAAPSLQESLPRPAELGREQEEALNKIDEFHPVSFYRAPEEGESAAPRYVPLTVRTEPADARIVVDEVRTGVGRASGVYRQGQTIRIQVEREGYQTVSFPITLRDVTGRTLNVTLQPVPEGTLRIETEPDDAEIVINSEIVGTGTVERSYPIGTELRVTALHPDYTAEEQTVTVNSDGSRSVTVSMTERPAESATGESDSRDAEETVETAPLSVVPEPSGARVVLNGEAAGPGTARGEFEVGSQVSIRVEADGYLSQSRRVLIREGDNRHEIRLEEEILTRPVRIRARPETAEILLNGRVVGTGSYEGEHELGEELRLTVQADEYLPSSRSLEVRESMPETVQVELEERAVERSVRFVTEPVDATVRVQGQSPAGAGGSYTLTAGRDYDVLVERPGFASARRTIAVTEGSPSEYRFELEPRPLVWDREAAPAGIVRALVSNGGPLYWASAEGTVGAISREGDALWTRSTANGANENSMPVPSGDLLFFSGGEEFLILSAGSGEVRSREDLSGGRSHVFGRVVTTLPEGYVFPTNDTLELVLSGEARSVPLTNGSTMSASYRDGMLYLADNQGVFLEVSVEGGEILREISTDAVQPVAHAPALLNDTAYFAGRRGTLVALDLANGSVRWSRSLGEGVFQQPLLSETGVYVFAGEEIYGLSHGGEELFAPLPDAAGAPAISGNELVYPATDGTLRFVNAETGAEQARHELPSVSRARPIYADPLIFVATGAGEIVALHRAGIR